MNTKIIENQVIEHLLLSAEMNDTLMESKNKKVTDSSKNNIFSKIDLE